MFKKNDESDSKDDQTDLITARILNNKMWSSFAFLSLPFWSMSWCKFRFPEVSPKKCLEVSLFLKVNKEYGLIA